LSDLAFQRHILVQALILIDFILSLTDKSKKKPYQINAQKALQYNFTLSEEDVSPHDCSSLCYDKLSLRQGQAEWALGIKNTIATYLQDAPDGKFYYRMVDTVLSRDKNWVRWKMENCPPIIRDRVSTKALQDAKSGARRAFASKRSKVNAMGLDLTFLSDVDGSSGLGRLKDADR
jgi:THO complex subunit 1